MYHEMSIILCMEKSSKLHKHLILEHILTNWWKKIDKTALIDSHLLLNFLTVLSSYFLIYVNHWLEAMTM